MGKWFSNAFREEYRLLDFGENSRKAGIFRYSIQVRYFTLYRGGKWLELTCGDRLEEAKAAFERSANSHKAAQERRALLAEISKSPVTLKKWP